eukprot:1047860-Prymnesium_polylepis.1
MPGGEFATSQLGVGQLLSYPIIAHAAVTEFAKILIKGVLGCCPGWAASRAGRNEKSKLLLNPPPTVARQHTL